MLKKVVMTLKMEALIPLAFLSDHPWSFSALDIVLYMLLLFVSYMFFMRVLPKDTRQEIKDKRPKLLYWISISLLLQLILMVLQMILLVYTPITPAINDSTPLDPLICVQICILIVCYLIRIINLCLLTSFFYICLRISHKNRALSIWAGLIIIIILVQLYSIFFSLFPTVNHLLYVYDTFYSIRSVLKQEGINKQMRQKYVSQYLYDLSCAFGGKIPDNVAPLVRAQAYTVVGTKSYNIVQQFIRKTMRCVPTQQSNPIQQLID